ncbi:zinc finger protein 551-like [Sinocyclocheilus anshuiensis]|uniref:zinc finger protein 551-like n=1 Tax=Sinocyclocheilus anshuiensis TaxID=1608454 RepID=UPI0007B8FAC2|nr:PREDICTED: zinc finger protein 551-like [Sinocyclocheilus anshuiensis]
MHTEQEEELPPLIPPKPPQTMQVTPAITSNVEQYKYRCGICQHQLSHQLTGPRSYQCNHCGMSFTHYHLFLTHLRSHGNEKASKDTNFPTSEKMIRVEPVKRDKIYQCPICPESFYQALDLANHLSVHSHMCSVCNMTFPTKKDLDEHEQCHLTAATQYECTECGDSFLGSDAFRKHHCSNRNVTFSEKHRSAPSVPSSKKQSSGTRFQAGDEEEEEVDVGEDFIICPICKRRFSSNSSLMEHHKKHHEDPRPFKCLVCKKGFTKKRYLTQHQQIHSERPYQCEVCSESFKTEPALISHRKMHDAKRQHQCPICSRTYLTANDLAKHKRKHAEHQSLSEDNREYRCDMCYKSFTMFAHLQKHQETHVGQVVYECTECDKAFAFLNLLEEHQRTHGAASTESLQSQSPTHFPYQSSVNE